MNLIRIGTVAALLFAAGACAFAEEKPDPREKLDTAIAEGIRLLEAKDYLNFIKQFVRPDELKKATEQMPIADLAKDFGEGNSGDLLKALKTLKDKKPVLTDDGKSAEYTLTGDEFKRKDIAFVKVDKYWYIKN